MAYYWLTPPSRAVFFLSVLLAVLALLVRYAHVAIPVVSNYSFETLLVAFLLLLAPPYRLAIDPIVTMPRSRICQVRHFLTGDSLARRQHVPRLLACANLTGLLRTSLISPRNRASVMPVRMALTTG